MFKKTIIAGLAATAILAAMASSASADQYSRWGPNGYSNTYTDFNVVTPGGTSYSGTIWGR